VSVKLTDTDRKTTRPSRQPMARDTMSVTAAMAASRWRSNSLTLSEAVSP
jgi:hypothetical protein